MKRILLFLALSLLSGPASAHSQHAKPVACAEPSLACATTVTPFATADGLWLAWSAGGRVSVARSDDGGASFAPAVIVSGAPATIDDGGEARPKVFADPHGRVLVTWTTRRDKAYVGTVWLARSTDGGRSFSAPKALSDDATSQRFETLGFTADGKIAALWVDKRRGRNYAGAALVATWSDDGGATFGPNQVVAEHSCECCRMGVAAGPDGLVVTWRQIFDGGLRDHAAATITPQGMGPVRRVAVDHWKVDACPHHGPALAVDGDGAWQVAWYTDGSARQGLFHARFKDGVFSAPMALGNADNQPSHPSILASGGVVWLAWKEFDGERSTIMAQSSTDGGVTWAAARIVAETKDSSDHPLLVMVGGQPRLSWLTRAEGWRLLPLDVRP